MPKAKITIEKIFTNKVNTKEGMQDTFTLMSCGNGFKGWGTPDGFKQGQETVIEYDENSKYQGKNTVYYNLIRSQTENRQEDTNIIQTQILIVLNTISDRIKRIEDKYCGEEEKKSIMIDPKDMDISPTVSPKAQESPEEEELRAEDVPFNQNPSKF